MFGGQAGRGTYVDRDRSYEIRYCSPTKSFAIVPSDGQSFRLDAAGNAKASALVRKIGKKQFIPVTIAGELNAKAIRVSSISSAFEQ